MSILLFPLFKNNEGLQILSEKINLMKFDLAREELNFEKIIEEGQKNCKHLEYEKEMSLEPKYIWAWPKTRKPIEIMISKTCKECGIKIVREEGPAWVICHQCGGAMDHLERKEFEGIMVWIYGCKECSHNAYHS